MYNYDLSIINRESVRSGFVDQTPSDLLNGIGFHTPLNYLRQCESGNLANRRSLRRWKLLVFNNRPGKGK